MPATPTFNIPDLKKLFPNFTFPGFLPDDLLGQLVPDVGLPGVDIGDICPGLETSGHDDQPADTTSKADSQRSFATALEKRPGADTDDLVDEYFREQEQQVRGRGKRQG